MFFEKEGVHNTENIPKNRKYSLKSYVSVMHRTRYTPEYMIYKCEIFGMNIIYDTALILLKCFTKENFNIYYGYQDILAYMIKL